MTIVTYTHISNRVLYKCIHCRISESIKILYNNVHQNIQYINIIDKNFKYHSLRRGPCILGEFAGHFKWYLVSIGTRDCVTDRERLAFFDTMVP